MKIEFEISDKSFELLKAIDKAGAAEFRDFEYKSLEDFKKSHEFSAEESGFRTEKWFKARNFCDFQDMDELIARDLVDTHEMAWHPTWVVSTFGKEILSKYKS
jgi:hypothetical protein